MGKQVWTSEELLEKYNNLTKDEEIQVLYEVINLMKIANWQSRSRVIFRAMGYRDINNNAKEWIKDS